MTWVSTCLPLSKNMLLTLSVGYFLTCACEGLKLLIFNAGVCTHGINDYEWGKCSKLSFTNYDIYVIYSERI